MKYSVLVFGGMILMAIILDMDGCSFSGPRYADETEQVQPF
jgi:hypothetical protein